MTTDKQKEAAKEKSIYLRISSKSFVISKGG